MGEPPGRAAHRDKSGCAVLGTIVVVCGTLVIAAVAYGVRGISTNVSVPHVATSDGTVDFAGHRIAADQHLDRLSDGEVCARITITATTAHAERVGIDQFAFGIDADLGRPTPEATPSESSMLTATTAYGLESFGRICARPRINDRPMDLRWHPHTVRETGLWFFHES